MKPSQLQNKFFNEPPIKAIIFIIVFMFLVSKLFAQPVITSNGGGATASINMYENTTVDLPLKVVTTVIATPGTGATTFTISGGVDAAKFSMTSGGVLSFNISLDYEHPGDADLNNQYIVTVRATDQSVPTPLYVEQTITVTVTNVNESPVISSAATASIPENTTYVMTLTATDPDAGSTLTYSIPPGPYDAAKFTINPNTGVLSFITAPDFENPNDLYNIPAVNDNIYAVIVKVTDAGIPTASTPTASTAKTIIVTITNVNDAPTNITLSNNIVAENLLSSATVATLSTTDQDVGNTFTYTMVGGDMASFNLVGATLQTAASFDFETKSSYSVTFRTTDQGGLYFEKTFTINVQDVNEAPTNITLSNNNINENMLVGSVVGNLSSTDHDAANTFTYTIQPGTDAGFFNISGTSLNSAYKFDFETKSSYSITIRTTDQGGLYFDKIFTININDVNEPPVVTMGGSGSFTENLCNGCFVITAHGVDPDIPPQTVTYSIVGGADQLLFNINHTTGVVTFIASPNYEAPTDADHNNTYDIVVRYSDGTLYTDVPMTFTILDANDSPTFTSYGGNSTTATINVPENAPTTNVIAQVSAFDEDTNPAWQNFTYSLSQTDAAFFNIDATGNITFKASPNFEAPANGSYNNQYILGVRASNDASHYSEQYFFIYVTDVNETPTDISLSNNTINENQPSGATVGILSTTDPDAANTFTYAIQPGSDATSFSISGATLQTTVSFDFETKGSYSVTIRTTDQGGLYFDKTFMINVQNVNETPTDISLSNNTISENQPIATVVGNLSTTDPDAVNTFTYTIQPGSDATSFSISGSALQTAASFNFEAKSSYSLTIRTTDQGGLYFEKVFTINVLNVNETPTDIALSNNTVSENQPTGTLVGNLTTTDPDATNTFSYTIRPGNDASFFSISGATLQTAASFNFETKSGYSLTIRATDQGGLYFEKIFTINVLNVNETPTNIILSNNSVSENQPINTTVGNFSTTDPDAANTFTYTILSGLDAASFNIFGATLQTSAILDFETQSVYHVTIRTTDQGGLYFDKTFTINVQNINETPTDITLSNNTVSENQLPGTIVGDLSTTDTDAGNIFTYTLSGTDAALFTISGATLQTSANLNYKTKSNYSLTIRSTDQGGLYIEKNFNIYVVCNLRSVLDWNTFPNGNDPDRNTYIEDGMPISFSMYDPHAIVNVFNTNNRFQTTQSVVWQQSPINNSQTSILTIKFGLKANQFCFTLLNVDYSGNNKDSVIIDPYFSGSKVSLNASEYTLSSAVTYKGNNTFIGNANVGNPSTMGNTQVCILPASDSIKISYGNAINTPGNNQSIGIGNFSWCEITNHAPEFINSLGSHIVYSRDTCYENILFRKHLRFRDEDRDSVVILKVMPNHGSVTGISMADSSFSYKANLNYSGFDTIRTVIKDNRVPYLTDTLTSYLYIIPINFPSNKKIDCSGDTSITITGKASPSIIAYNLPVVVTYKTISNQSANPSNVGYYNYTLTRTWLVSDLFGNYCQQNQTITVSDTVRPVISGCPGNINVNNDLNSCSAIINWTEPTATDNCTSSGNLIWTKSHSPGSSFDVGTTHIVYKVIDASGNQDSCNFTITVSDVIKPTITAPADLTVNSDAGSNSASGIVLGTPVTADNCGVALVTNNAPVIFPAGTTKVIWTVTDIHGNSATAEQNVTVINDYPPVITSPEQATIPENTVNVITVTATDPDIGNTLTFSIIGGTDASKLSINPTSGALNFLAAPDFELPNDGNQDNIYVVKVMVADNFGLTDTVNISVTVTNVNDAPTDILLSNANVNEHQSSGTLVGTLTTVDQDLGDSHTYSISGTDAAYFNIAGDSLKTTASFDYTTRHTFNIIIRSTDSYGASFEKPFIITVNNINEAPVILTANNTPADTLNFEAFGNEITQICLNVTDPDNDETSITGLHSINGSGSLVAEAGNHNCFNYTPSNGFLGREILFVTVCDNGTPSLCDTVIIIMNVVPRFIFSQVISPNGDGINDNWVCGGLERYPDNKVTIFSRWGDIVYKATGYDNVNIVWNGEFNNGKTSKGQVPDGTYFYIIELGNGSKLTGFIVLNR